MYWLLQATQQGLEGEFFRLKDYLLFKLKICNKMIIFYFVRNFMHFKDLYYNESGLPFKHNIKITEGRSTLRLCTTRVECNSMYIFVHTFNITEERSTLRLCTTMDRLSVIQCTYSCILLILQREGVHYVYIPQGAGGL